MNELKTILSSCKKHGMNETLLSLYEKHGMSEGTKVFCTIWLLYNDRLKLEKLPRTSKIEAKIEELRSLEGELKKAVKDPDFVRRLKQSAIRKAMEKVEKVVAGGKHGGETSGKVRREKVKPTREAWQKEAEKIWQKHSTWSNKSVAKMIVKRIGGNIDTIRKIIQKPLP